MADRGLISAVIATGVDEVAAEDMIERVYSAIVDRLRAGKSVTIPDVGRLAAPRKPVWVPGRRNTAAVEQRKVALSSAAVLEKGEPYEVRVFGHLGRIT